MLSQKAEKKAHTWHRDEGTQAWVSDDPGLVKKGRTKQEGTGRKEGTGGISLRAQFESSAFFSRVRSDAPCVGLMHLDGYMLQATTRSDHSLIPNYPASTCRRFPGQASNPVERRLYVQRQGKDPSLDKRHNSTYETISSTLKTLTSTLPRCPDIAECLDLDTWQSGKGNYTSHEIKWWHLKAQP